LHVDLDNVGQLVRQVVLTPPRSVDADGWTDARWGYRENGDHEMLRLKDPELLAHVFGDLRQELPRPGRSKGLSVFANDELGAFLADDGDLLAAGFEFANGLLLRNLPHLAETFGSMELDLLDFGVDHMWTWKRTSPCC
ncbi:hypothetical protein HK102_011966, partial [Quaeritorhiza haematococci]